MTFPILICFPAIWEVQATLIMLSPVLKPDITWYEEERLSDDWSWLNDRERFKDTNDGSVSYLWLRLRSILVDKLGAGNIGWTSSVDPLLTGSQLLKLIACTGFWSCTGCKTGPAVTGNVAVKNPFMGDICCDDGIDGCITAWTLLSSWTCSSSVDMAVT